jgi:hypothetical protein
MNTEKGLCCAVALLQVCMQQRQPFHRQIIVGHKATNQVVGQYQVVGHKAKIKS